MLPRLGAGLREEALHLSGDAELAVEVGDALQTGEFRRRVACREGGGPGGGALLREAGGRDSPDVPLGVGDERDALRHGIRVADGVRGAFRNSGLPVFRTGVDPPRRGDLLVGELGVRLREACLFPFLRAVVVDAVKASV